MAVLRLSFKPGTDDIRDGRHCGSSRSCKAERAEVRAHDPAAMPQVRELQPGVSDCDKAEEALRGSQAVVVAREWDEYRDMTLERIGELLAYPVVVDARTSGTPMP